MVASSDLSLDPAAMGGEGDGIREKISTGGVRQKLIGNPRKILCYGPDGVAASRTPKRAKTEGRVYSFSSATSVNEEHRCSSLSFFRSQLK
jgi:hypothetical protein